MSFVASTVVALLACVSLPLAAAINDEHCDATAVRVDCGWVGIGQRECIEKGCCWNPLDASSHGAPDSTLRQSGATPQRPFKGELAPGGTPWCYHHNTPDTAITYTLDNVTETDSALRGSLKIDNDALSSLGQSLEELKLHVSFARPDVVRITIEDVEGKRLRVPEFLLPGLKRDEDDDDDDDDRREEESASADAAAVDALPAVGTEQLGSDAALPRRALRSGAARPEPSGAPRVPTIRGSSGPASTRRRCSVHNAAGSPRADVGSRSYCFEHTASPFSFSVLRASDPPSDSSVGGSDDEDDDGGRPLFELETLVFKERYMELTTLVPESSVLYGLGEQSRHGGVALPRNSSVITMWNRDWSSNNENTNLYGSHPFLLELRRDGSASGLFLANCHGMDVVLARDRVQFRVVGGVLDLFVMTGPSLEEVVRQYQRVVGTPALMPAWSLGFHQSRWGYDSVDALNETVMAYRGAGIPLDTIWSDIDHMDGKRDFTLDQQKFSAPKMQSFLSELHARGQKWVPIVDPGIKIDPGYPAYDAGMAADVWVKDANGDPYVGAVWPGPVHFPDFLHEPTVEYWHEQLKDFHSLAPFDGIWIDMNEISNFVTGDICRVGGDAAARLARSESHASSSSVAVSDAGITCEESELGKELRKTPYHIASGGGDLSTRTISVAARHHDGALEWEVHNVFGLSESIATASAVADATGKRPFVLSRSTFSGSGSHVAHWTGDNAAAWEDLAVSISTCLTFNMMSVPMVGADICGFIGDTNMELCARWISVGAFYTFARDHSMNDAAPQELYRWPEVASAARNALGLRYKLLPYLYTLLWSAHARGGTVMRPVFWDTPRDEAARNATDQWLWGSAVMFSPVVTPGKTSRSVYLAEGQWLCWAGCPNATSAAAAAARRDLALADVFSDGGALPADTECDCAGPLNAACHLSTMTGCQHVQVDDVQLDRVPVWFRLGSIIPLVGAFSEGSPAPPGAPPPTAVEALNQPLHLVVLLGESDDEGSDGDEDLVSQHLDIGTHRHHHHHHHHHRQGDAHLAAVGEVYWDDGEEIIQGELGRTSVRTVLAARHEVKADSGILTNVLRAGLTDSGLNVAKVELFGLPSPCKHADEVEVVEQHVCGARRTASDSYKFIVGMYTAAQPWQIPPECVSGDVGAVTLHFGPSDLGASACPALKIAGNWTISWAANQC